MQENVALNLVDCLTGITYTEFGSIYGYSGVSAETASETWKAQAVAIYSYLLYQNQIGESASNALIYTPVNQIQSTTPTTCNVLRTAVEQVANQLVVYGSGSDGFGCQLWDTVYSCSGGYNTLTGVYGTCAGLDAWGIRNGGGADKKLDKRGVNRR